MLKTKFIPKPKESVKVIKKRWSKKRESVETLANNMQRLRYNVSTDLKSDNEKIYLTALVVSIMAKTAERIGNEASAKKGHVGITGLTKNQVTIIGNKVMLEYVGKSGVEHEKMFSDERIAKALKRAKKNSPSDFIFVTSKGFKIKSDRVNRYLSDFEISNKSIRGFAANDWLIKKLKEVDIEDTESKRKRQFNIIARKIAHKVGHGLPTLKKHYLIPEIEPNFVMQSIIVSVDDVKKFNEGGSIDSDEKTKKMTPDKNNTWYSFVTIKRSNDETTMKLFEGKITDKEVVDYFKSGFSVIDYDIKHIKKTEFNRDNLFDYIDKLSEEKFGQKLNNHDYIFSLDKDSMVINEFEAELENGEKVLIFMDNGVIEIKEKMGNGGTIINGIVIPKEIESLIKEQKHLEEESNFYSLELKKFSDDSGLVSQDVRGTEEYKSIKIKFDDSFSKLQEFNKSGKAKIISDFLRKTDRVSQQKIRLYYKDSDNKMKKGGVTNPYAVCTTSIGKTEGTRKRSDWDKPALEKYENCVLDLKDKMHDGGGILPSHYIKVTDKSGDFIGVIKFNPNNNDRVSNLADLVALAKKAGYKFIPIDIEKYRELVVKIDYEKLKKYQDDIDSVNKNETSIHDKPFEKGGGLNSKNDKMELKTKKIIQDNPNYQLVESTHTKKDKDIFVLILKNKVEDKFKVVSSRIERAGGYYSGQQKGFVFSRILSEKEIKEIFKGIFFEETPINQEVDEKKDAWTYTVNELKSLPHTKRADGTFIFKYTLDSKEKTYSVKVPSSSVDDAALSFGKQIITNALIDNKYNKAVEKGDMSAERAAQIIKSTGYSLIQINDNYGELNEDIQAIWLSKRKDLPETLDKVRYPYLYERNEMPHLSDTRYNQIVYNALHEGKYDALIKDESISSNKAAFIIESAGFEIPDTLLSDAKYEKHKEVESLVGGYADSQTIFDISERHKVPVKEIIRQFKKGLKVEREHTNDKSKMAEIVKDHLFESPYYYDVLLKSEETMRDIDPSMFKTHEEYMKAYDEKEKELEGMTLDERADIKTRPIIDKISYLKKQIDNGVPQEVENFMRNGIINQFVKMFDDIVCEYPFYVTKWLELQSEYLTDSQKNDMLMYGIYNNANLTDESVKKFISKIIEDDNNIYDLLPNNEIQSVNYELGFELFPKDKHLAMLLDSFVNKGKILSATLGAYFSEKGVFASKYSLDIFIKGKNGYLPKNKIEEGIYGLSESAKDIFPSYGLKRLAMINDSKSINFFKKYMETYNKENIGNVSEYTNNDIFSFCNSLRKIYDYRAFIDYNKKELLSSANDNSVNSLKVKITSYPMLYVKCDNNLVVVSLNDMLDALYAYNKLGRSTAQIALSDNGIYISENIKSFLKFDETGIRVSIKRREEIMPEGVIYFDLSKKEFLTNRLEIEEEKNIEIKKDGGELDSLNSRLKTIRKMIEKNPSNKEELEERAKALENMINENTIA